MSDQTPPDGTDGHVDLLGLLRGELPNDEALAAAGHLDTCQECRSDLVDAAVSHGLMSRAATTAQPRGRRAADVDRSAALPRPSRPAPTVPRGRRRLLAPAVAAAVVLVAGGAWLLRPDGGAPDRDVVVAPTPSPSSSGPAADGVLLPVRGDGTGEVWLTPRDGGAELTLRTAGLPATGPAEGYYAWLLDDTGRRLLPLGQVSSSGTTSFEVDDRQLADYSVVDVSLEPDDGDPGHSSDSLLRGDLT